MRAGFSATNVTPPLGMALEGLGQPGGIESIHDELYIRALYMKHETKEVLIVSFDLLFFAQEVIDRFKGRMGVELQMLPKDILLNFTHTHAGPRVSEWAYGGAPEPRYVQHVENALVCAAKQAKANAVDVTVWAGETQTDVPCSRRRRMDDGHVEWAPYPEGEICSALPFCLLKDGQDNVVSVVFSVSCHPSMIYTPTISADYPGAAVRELNTRFNTQGALFLQGAGGDTKPRQIAGEERWIHGTWEDVDATGTAIAEAVANAAQTELRAIEPELRTSLQLLDLPFTTRPTEEELLAWKNAPTDATPPVREERRRWADDMLACLRTQGELAASAPVELHAVQLGKGLRLIGLGGEATAPLGNLILSCFTQGITMPLGYTNTCQMYLPADKQLPEGGYEVDSFWEYHWPAELAPGIDARLEQAVRAQQTAGICPDSA